MENTNLATIIVSIASLITSIFSAYFIYQQTGIYREQTEIQKKQNQPIFIISIYQRQDSDDGKYGTEILEVRNKGAKILQSNISNTVFYRLSHHSKMKNDSIYAEVLDYFNSSVVDNTGDDMIMCSWGIGSNRNFAQCYRKAIDASKNSNDIYFFDKIIVTKITYQDILQEVHTVYFQHGQSISKQQYDNYFNCSKTVWGDIGFALKNISFDVMKAKMDELSL